MQTFRLRLGQLRAWTFHTCSRCCLIIKHLLRRRRYYLHVGGKVYYLPLEYTPERILFWREVRNDEATSNRNLQLSGLKEMCNAEDVLERLGFHPVFEVVDITHEVEV